MSEHERIPDEDHTDELIRSFIGHGWKLVSGREASKLDGYAPEGRFGPLTLPGSVGRGANIGREIVIISNSQRGKKMRKRENPA